MYAPHVHIIEGGPLKKLAPKKTCRRQVIIHTSPAVPQLPRHARQKKREKYERLIIREKMMAALSYTCGHDSGLRIRARGYDHYVRYGHHCRHHHCWISENRRWCTFTAGYELENEKMIGAGLKPTVKHHITVGLWLEPTVFWWPLITAGSSHKPAVIWPYHCRFYPRTDGDKPIAQKGYSRPLLPPLFHPENRGARLGPSLHCCGCSLPWS